MTGAARRQYRSASRRGHSRLTTVAEFLRELTLWLASQAGASQAIEKNTDRADESRGQPQDKSSIRGEAIIADVSRIQYSIMIGFGYRGNIRRPLQESASSYA